jgi:pyruvate formate lyase activating enzyme
LKELPMKPFSGNIFQIQRWSINDGEGIRSTVFLKGCPLRCKWCANPESWNFNPEVLFFRERCSGCGQCAHVCDTDAITIENNAIGLDRARCCGCGKCCDVCPTDARKKIGSTVTVEEVLSVIKRDAIFYRESGGGVTFSGGEPFAQPEFLRQLVAACNRIGIDTAVETSGWFEWEQVKDIFEILDSVFVDIKHIDDEVHKRLTGVSNSRILENIILLSQMHPQIIIRVPLIEGVNTDENNISRMCEFLRQNAWVAGIELLPYHDFGESKYSAVGAACQTFTTPDATKIAEIKKIITDYGIGIVDFK